MKHIQYQLGARDSIVLIMIICATFYIISLEVRGKPVVSTAISEQTGYNSKESVLPARNKVGKNNQIEEFIRDPFARLPKAQEVNHGDSPVVVSNVAPVLGNTASLAPCKTLLLTGIVSSDDQQLAVIMLGSKSQSYSLHERIDTYKLTEIHDDSIVLENKAEKLVLQLGAVKQKEDKISGK